MEFSLASQLFLGCVKKTPGNLSPAFVDTVEILAEPIRLCCIDMRHFMHGMCNVIAFRKSTIMSLRLPDAFSCPQKWLARKTKWSHYH